MIRITSFKELTQFLRKIANAYCQADYAQLYQELQLRYEQQIFSAFLDGHPSWSIVQGEIAYTLLLYHGWNFSRDWEENARQMTAIAQEIDQHYSDIEKIPISMQAAETVMRVVERTYLFSRHIWKGHHTLIFLLPATHRTEDSFVAVIREQTARCRLTFIYWSLTKIFQLPRRVSCSMKSGT